LCPAVIILRGGSLSLTMITPDHRYYGSKRENMNDIAVVRQQVRGTDLGDAVRNAGLLASVQISVWEGMKLDRKSLEQLKQLHGASGDIGRVNINLLTGHDGLLKDVHSAFFAVRSRHYELTLPWVSDPHAARQRGPRWLSNLLFEQYVKELSRLKNVAVDLLEGSFVPAYPGLVAAAQANLGTIAQGFNYPAVEEIRKLFRVHFDFEPIPEGASFTGLDNHTLDQLSTLLDKKRERQIAEATKAMWAETKARIEALIAATKKPNAATVGNVRELLTLLPGWNITGNAAVTEIANDIDQLLYGIEAEDLRKDEKLRGDTAVSAQKIVDKMARWGL
jgi:hypothetical protein